MLSHIIQIMCVYVIFPLSGCLICVVDLKTNSCGLHLQTCLSVFLSLHINLLSAGKVLIWSSHHSHLHVRTRFLLKILCRTLDKASPVALSYSIWHIYSFPHIHTWMEVVATVPICLLLTHLWWKCVNDTFFFLISVCLHTLPQWIWNKKKDLVIKSSGFNLWFKMSHKDVALAISKLQPFYLDCHHFQFGQ